MDSAAKDKTEVMSLLCVVAGSRLGIEALVD